MAKANLIRSSEFPYHVRARTNNKDWFTLDLSECWSIFNKYIKETHLRYGFETHCFVLMSNHFHWVMKTPFSNIDSGMQYFMTRTSTEIARSAGRINKIYGSRYKWSLIDNPIYYANVVRYVYQNPLRAKICKNVTNYQWSTLNRKMFDFNVESPSNYSEYIPCDSVEFIDWLNEDVPESFNSKIKKGLRRFHFSPNKRDVKQYLKYL